MSIELILATLRDDSEDENGGQVLHFLEEELRKVLNRFGEETDAVELTTEMLFVHLPGGTAEIHADSARFPIEELDPLTLQVVFETARSGDMAILTEGGDYCAILTAASQRARLPEREWRTTRASPVCRSAKRLGLLMENWYQEHADYRDQAVADCTESSSPTRSNGPSSKSEEQTTADWSARVHSDDQVKRLSDPAPANVPAGGIPYRWDPWVGDHVANGPEAELVRFHRFDTEANEIPNHPHVLRDLKSVCERHLKENKGGSNRLIDDHEWPPLDLRSQFYSADIWPCRADFRLYELTDSVAQLMLEIAQAGDMSLILPGSLILTDSGQVDRLPETWKQTYQVVICQSPIELKSSLRSLHLDIPPEDRDYGFNDEEPPPGTYPSRARVIYLEAKPKESAVQHQNKVYKHRPQDPDIPFRPDSGMMMARFWRLETPAGQRFYAYDHSGEGWMNLLRDFAESEQRTIAEVVNFETFVTADGGRIPISECETRKVDAVGSE